MRKSYSFINPSLLVEELFCFVAIGIGIYGIVSTERFVLSIALCASALAVALTLFAFQYHRVIVSCDGVTIFYFRTTLFSKIEDIPTVNIASLWGVRLPLSTYYALKLGVISGKRAEHVDGEIVRTRRLALALISVGVKIEDKKDKHIATPALVSAEVMKAEHKLRDKVIRTHGKKGTRFLYRAVGVTLSERPYGSYTYGYESENAFVPLLEVTRHRRSFSFKDVSKLG